MVRVPPAERFGMLEADRARTGRRLDDLERPDGSQYARALDRLREQVAELTSRKTHTVQPADVAASGNATVAPFPQATRVFTFPAPVGGARSAQLVFSWRLTNSVPGNSANAFCAMTYDGQTVWRDDEPVPRALSAPDGWESTMSDQIALVVPADTVPVFALTIYRVGFTSASSAVGAAGITATLLYGDKV